VNRKWTSRDGEKKEETCFVDCRAFGRTAENINKYLSKGRAEFIEGRLTFDSWTAQDGTKLSMHWVTVETFQFLPGGGGGGRETEPTERGIDNRAEGGEWGTPKPQEPSAADDIPF